jgi:hypothetical protein
VRFAVVCLTLAACSFSTKLTTGDDVPVDGAIDAPPESPSVKFVSLTSMTTQLRPGLYGIEITAMLRNDLPNPITNLAVTLTFGDRAADFRWRDVDAREGVMALQPQMIDAASTAVYRFKIDALPWAVPPGPIAINGAATFVDGATPLSASPADVPLMLPFATLNAPIVVNNATDESDGDMQLCLREAIARANTQSGFDRIVFDPAVFPPGSPVTTLLADSLGELPTINQDLVIDGHGAGVIVAVDQSWENDNRYALKISAGNVVVGELTFKNFGYGYQNEGDLSANNCGSGTFFDGGALRIDGGQLTLDGNTFEDPDVSERNCFGAAIRLEGGTRHRILNNTFTNQTMDSIYVDASTLEISGNVMNAGTNTSKVDECIFIATQGAAPLWITNNICADMEFSAVVAGGTDAGALFIVNNTFVRNGRTDLSAVRRSGNRAITLRNNVYVGNNPAAINLDANGAGFNVAYESFTTSPLFNGNSSQVTNNAASNLNPANAGLVDAAGATRETLAPTAGSPLVNSGVDTLDVNGVTPNHYNGIGADRGAIERP